MTRIATAEMPGTPAESGAGLGIGHGVGEARRAFGPAYQPAGLPGWPTDRARLAMRSPNRHVRVTFGAMQWVVLGVWR